MTYLAFHLRFNAPLLGAVAAVAWPSWGAGDCAALVITSAIVMAFTSPWDNWAVRERIWEFPETRVLFRIGHLPVEEYAFFLVETAQVCLLADSLAAHVPDPWATGKATPMWGAAGCGAAAWLASYLALRRVPVPRRFRYLVHLLFWMLPVVAIQWLLGGAFIGRPVAVCGATILIGGILTLFDAAAIRHGIWFFDESQTLGIKIGDVPIEEAMFFLLTALLVAQSYALFAP